MSIVLNTLTRFGKLAVGKHVVSAKQLHSSGDPPFPLAVALNGLQVWVDYQPHPKNKFKIRVNDDDVYNLVKAEVNYDQS